MFIGWGPCEEWAKVDQLEQIPLVVAWNNMKIKHTGIIKSSLSTAADAALSGDVLEAIACTAPGNWYEPSGGN